MHSLDKTDLVRISSLIKPNQYCTFSEIKKCPQCQSFYVTDTRCDACGQVFLGEGQESFADIKDTHFESLPLWAKWYPFLERQSGQNFKRFIQKIKKRGMYLLFSLNQQARWPYTYEKDSRQRQVILLELEQIFKEFAYYGVHLSSIEEWELLIDHITCPEEKVGLRDKIHRLFTQGYRSSRGIIPISKKSVLERLRYKIRLWKDQPRWGKFSLGHVFVWSIIIFGYLCIARLGVTYFRF